MITPQSARDLYVKPALQRLGAYSINAEMLLMGTAAVESNFTNFVQFGGGPARGMFQMEAVTFTDIMDRYLAIPSHRNLRNTIIQLSTNNPPQFLNLASDHLLAAGLARVKYAMISEPIPSNLSAQADYWWQYYNGRSPHGLNSADYIQPWNQYCKPLYPAFS